MREGAWGNFGTSPPPLLSYIKVGRPRPARALPVRAVDEGDAAALHSRCDHHVRGLWTTGNPIRGGCRRFLLGEVRTGQRAACGESAGQEVGKRLLVGLQAAAEEGL